MFTHARRGALSQLLTLSEFDINIPHASCSHRGSGGFRCSAHPAGLLLLAAYNILASSLCLLDSDVEAQAKAQEEAQAEAKAKAHAKALVPF